MKVAAAFHRGLSQKPEGTVKLLRLSHYQIISLSLKFRICIWNQFAEAAGQLETVLHPHVKAAS